LTGREVAAFVTRIEAEGGTKKHARALLALADTAQQLAVVSCNVGLSDELRAIDAANDAAIRAVVASLGSGWGLEIQGDPRGACVKVKVPSGRGDSWGDPAFLCVPTAGY
jgi:hypothetical protein